MAVWSAGALVAGAAISAYGSSSTNAKSIRAQRDLYQHRYQWQMEDMQKAGLNPMLSFQQAPPSVSAPNLSNPYASVGDAVSKVPSAVMAYKQQQENLYLTRAQGNKAMAEGDLADKQARQIEATTPYSGTSAALSVQNATQQLDNLKLTAENLQRDLRAKDQTYVTQQQLQPLLVEYQKYMNAAAKASIPEKEAEAKFWTSVPGGKFGTIGLELAKALKMILK